MGSDFGDPYSVLFVFSPAMALLTLNSQLPNSGPGERRLRETGKLSQEEHGRAQASRHQLRDHKLSFFVYKMERMIPLSPSY